MNYHNKHSHSRHSQLNNNIPVTHPKHYYCSHIMMVVAAMVPTKLKLLLLFFFSSSSSFFFSLSSHPLQAYVPTACYGTLTKQLGFFHSLSLFACCCYSCFHLLFCWSSLFVRILRYMRQFLYCTCIAMVAEKFLISALKR